MTDRKPLTVTELEALPRDAVVFVGSPVFAIADLYKRVRGGWRRFNGATFKPVGATSTSEQIAAEGAYS